MHSRNLLNIFLVIGLAGLIALAVYEPGKEPPPTAAPISSLKPETIHHLVIEAAGQERQVFNKQDDRWHMQQPFTVPANTKRIEKLLAVVGAKSIAQYAMIAVDANQLQLDAPTLTLMANKLSLEFGATEALSGSRYVKIANTVHLITDRYTYLARGAATAFVSPTLIPANASITALRLPHLLLRNKSGHWQAEGTNTDAASADQIQQLLDGWRHARALLVTKETSKLDTIAPTESIFVHLATETDPVQFGLLRTDDEIILARKDLGLRFHFPLETGERLLSLQAESHSSE